MSGAVRVGLVGYGSSGRGIHAPLLQEAGLDVALVATSSPERAAAATADHPDARVVPDLGAVLAAGTGRGGVDLVVLTSPTGVHEEQVLACVAAGRPVLVEKPLAVDAAGAARCVRAARAADVPLTVFQNRRWDDEQRALAAVLAAGEIGDVLRLERRWERWRPVPKDRWRENAPPADGGGLLLDLQSHLVDSAVQLLGPVESVYAEVSAVLTPAEDTTFLALRHAGGARSHLSAVSAAGAPGPRTRVLGTGGAYVVVPFEGEVSGFAGVLDDAPGCTGWVVRGAERTPVPTPPGGHADLYRAAAAAVRGEGAWPVDPADAVAVLAVLDAARASARTGEVVPVRVPDLAT
ncbi:Gfo/Idh/MocA family oxidoreductase [Pseudokineococcus basanitobsidens]|uniref:Gfo/Idh/MocA family oxidoreductase n=1 Tax=Pseudokineococcus basanitobsidens TaxID=1926649 RepID=A0ABU8RKL5_9ACTN